MKRLIQYLIILFLVGLLTSAVLWSDYQAGLAVCRGVEVRIVNDDSTSFVTKEGMQKELQSLRLNPVGTRISDINTYAIEKALEKSAYLEDVECYVSNNDKIVIEATQMVPVLRVFDGTDSYYVNRTGKRMPDKGRYFVDVPVVYGHFNGKFQPTQLLPLIDYVQDDPTLNALVTMYSVRDSNNVYIIPAISGHVVNMGNVKNYESKFAKLLKFYHDVMPVKGWNTYSEISLKWDYQVVGRLRQKNQSYESSYNPDEDEQAPDLGMLDIQGNETLKKGDDDVRHDDKNVKAENKEEKVTAIKSKTDKTDKKETVVAEKKPKKASEDNITDKKVKSAFQDKKSLDKATGNKKSSSKI